MNVKGDIIIFASAMIIIGGAFCYACNEESKFYTSSKKHIDFYAEYIQMTDSEKISADTLKNVKEFNDWYKESLKSSDKLSGKASSLLSGLDFIPNTSIMYSSP